MSTRRSPRLLCPRAAGEIFSTSRASPAFLGPMPRTPHRSAWLLSFRRVFAGGCVGLCLCPSIATSRDYFVDKSGANGAFPTVQSAVDAVSGQTETDRANIFIAPGKYIERVAVDKPFVTFIGQGKVPT